MLQAGEVLIFDLRGRGGGRLLPGRRAAGSPMDAYDADGARELRGGSGVAFEFTGPAGGD